MTDQEPKPLMAINPEEMEALIQRALGIITMNRVMSHPIYPPLEWFINEVINEVEND